MTIWYSADPHWGHRFVARLRGFGEDPYEHDEWLRKTYAEAFKPGDVVWWLGDLTMNLKPVEAAAKTIATGAAADHRLIFGNHDVGHPMHREAHRHQKAYYGFKMAQPFAKRRLPEVGEVLLSHFPLVGDHGVERYSPWRLRDSGIPVIHGHTHGTEKVTYSPWGTIQVHVGWDAWQRPVAEHEIVDLIKAAKEEQG